MAGTPMAPSLATRLTAPRPAALLVLVGAAARVAREGAMGVPAMG
jgi:hypothetical protein